jgi:Na+-driven multidrug efflux pump
VIKTDVTLALSQGNKHQAKKLALMGLNLSFLAGALFSVLVWIFRRSIAWQYSTVPSVLGILETMIETGSLFLFLTGPIPGFLGIGRTIGYENTVTGVRLVCSMVIATIVYYILYCTDLPKGYVAWAMGVQAVLYYILFCGSYSMLDWNKLELPERRPSVLYKLKNEGVFEL